MKLFTQFGFKGTTTRMIAEAVGIRQPSLFNHFKKKNDILAALVEEGATTFFKYLEALDLEAGAPDDLLITIVEFDVAFLLTEPWGIKQILALPEVKSGELQGLVSKKYEQILAVYKRVIQRGIEAKQFQVNDVDLAATTLIGMVESVWLRFQLGLDCDREFVSNQIAKMAVASISR